MRRHLSTAGTREHLHALREVYQRTPFEEVPLEQALRRLADERGVKAGTLIHGTRIAMTGRMVSPGLFEMLVLLGRDRVLTRLDALTRLEAVG